MHVRVRVCNADPGLMCLCHCALCRLCTRIRVYLAIMKDDEALTDRLAFTVNTW